MIFINNFQGKVAVVTGAANGIGKALCKELTIMGAKVYALDVNEKHLELMKNINTNIKVIKVDVSNREDVYNAINNIYSDQGRIDYMFNNAGILIGGETHKMTGKQWDNILKVNLNGVIYGSQIAYELMLKQGFGHIINTSSTAGIVPVCQSVAYTCTKFGVVGLSLSLDQEARKHGVKVSVLILGAIDTEIFSNADNLSNYQYDKKMSNPLIKKLSPQNTAKHIMHGVNKGHRRIVVPSSVRIIIAMYRLFPQATMWLMSKIM